MIRKIISRIKNKLLPRISLQEVVDILERDTETFAIWQEIDVDENARKLFPINILNSVKLVYKVKRGWFIMEDLLRPITIEDDLSKLFVSNMELRKYLENQKILSEMSIVVQRKIDNMKKFNPDLQYIFYSSTDDKIYKWVGRYGYSEKPLFFPNGSIRDEEERYKKVCDGYYSYKPEYIEVESTEEYREYLRLIDLKRSHAEKIVLFMKIS